MTLKSKIRGILRRHYGPFDSLLEHQYEHTLTENLIDGPFKVREAWITYNQVILELKHSLKDMLRVKELQYKLTDDGNPNEIILEVIEDVKTFTPELERLYCKIKNL